MQKLWKKRIAATLSLLWLAHAMPAFGSDAGAAPYDESQRPLHINITSLKELDDFIKLRQAMAWDVREQSAEFGKDLAGLTIVQNTDAHVFTAAADTEWTALRAKAAAQSAAGNAPSLAITLIKAEKFANREVTRLGVLSSWHQHCGNIAPHEAALKIVLNKAPTAEARVTRARIDPLLDEMRGALPLYLESERWEDIISARYGGAIFNVFAAYNTERVRLVPFARETDRKNGIAPLSRVRSAPCEPPFPSPSGKEDPSIDARNLGRPDYPPDARRQGIEGSVHVRAWVSATGCAERVAIERSVGYPLIDESALRWAEGIRFHPAEKDGKPQAAEYVFIVTFNLTD